VNRREFFRLPAALALFAAVPAMAEVPATAKTEKLLVNASGIERGKVREMITYNIEWDSYDYRLDMHDGKQQAYVTYRIDADNMQEMEKEDFLLKQREEGLEKLYKYGRDNGMDLSNLIALELPQNIEHVRYI
jgi:hypothetical protein